MGGAKPEAFEAKWMGEKLGGIVEVTCQGLRETCEGWADSLYMDDCDNQTQPAKLTFIPYYSWANRQVGEMRVWVRE